MSGKLIMKRKLDKTEQSTINNKVETNQLSASPSSVSQENKLDKKSDEQFYGEPENKRIHCDTPPPEPEDLDLTPAPEVVVQNRHLLEAIQLKILELQNELDAFEHDVEAHEESYYYRNDPHQNHENNQISEAEAEALGFAMCAQETLLFLQREGVPLNSLLYTRLHEALVGRSQTNGKFQF